jgi:peptide chain release factor 3
MAPANYAGARWVSCDDEIELRRFLAANGSRLALDAADTSAYLMSSRYDLELTQERWPKIEFHPMREHAGLVLQGG